MDELQTAGKSTGSGLGLGIFLSDDLLTDPTLSLKAKIIYLLVKRDFEKTGKQFTSKLTDPCLALMTGFSESTVQRKLHELDKKGYLSLVTNTRARQRDQHGRATDIRAVRLIYLDRKLAGYRKRSNRKKRL